MPLTNRPRGSSVLSMNSSTLGGGLSGPGQLIALIGDEDTCVGFLFGGIGEHTPGRSPELNFLVVTPGKTSQDEIERHFRGYLIRSDIAIILIQQKFANQIRPLIDAHRTPIPAVIEIPSWDAPYDPAKDSVLKRAKGLLGFRP